MTGRARPHVVFLRAANVGGRNVFRPARLAADLAHLDVVNIGAAGTFVVRGKASAAAVRRELVARLPFESVIVVRPAAEVLAFVRSRPFAGVRFSKDLRGWVAALAGPPKLRPALPLARPAGAAWSVRLDRVDGAFAIGLWQRRPKLLFPDVEAELGVAGTVRYWETFERIARVLEA